MSEYEDGKAAERLAVVMFLRKEADASRGMPPVDRSSAAMFLADVIESERHATTEQQPVSPEVLNAETAILREAIRRLQNMLGDVCSKKTKKVSRR